MLAINDLPSFEQSEAAVKRGDANPLQIFVEAQEPAGDAQELEFRAQFCAAVNYLSIHRPTQPEMALRELYDMVIAALNSRDVLLLSGTCATMDKVRDALGIPTQQQETKRRGPCGPGQSGKDLYEVIKQQETK